MREQLQQRNAGEGARAPEAPTTGEAARPQTGASMHGESGRAASSRRADIGETISGIYSTVRHLMGQRTQPQLDLDPNDDDVELVQLRGSAVVALEYCQSEISGSRERVSVQQRLQESAAVGGPHRRISPETLESVGVVESLVDTIESDNMLSSSAKDWIRQLELTLDKVATSNDDFLDTENPHGSLAVLNELARLGGTESSGVKRNVDEIVSYINENFDSNPNVFDEALGKLKPLVEAAVPRIYRQRPAYRQGE
ncbi:MAG: DUF1631 family protein [Gammaproteobacteria bacterium]|nr:DUF1631 family protein [Gammaproteobacteria bacterium]